MTEARPVERRIYDAGRTTRDRAERLPIDEWADQVTRLSDAEVSPDPVIKARWSGQCRCSGGLDVNTTG
ncbi:MULTISPECIES: hypothetical protein [Rhizobium]|uniref:Uncharacterized protein n=1 Tax=Rhizobium favelukesii TaxID=348824 RepID=W6RFS8_9HYPH|nr:MULTISPECIES: hypothetical protein [Rhizobium]MCS0462713.1 hypothetical protein [Rhizobium favelukesii]UFS85124.1 hypothetical protein LPB79_31825 [Rhizobium sp. T136]CDM60092.1 hypothetical protein LPU83_pLPU83b_0093 [Rhizobium favelukesii]